MVFTTKNNSLGSGQWGRRDILDFYLRTEQDRASFPGMS